MTRISVITVCKNAEVSLDATIQSVLTQSYQNIEYIVVDGASTDATPLIIDRYRSDLAHVISEPDQGVYDAMNKGIKIATGDFIYFANADDYLFSDQVFQNWIQVIHNHPDVDLIYGDHEARFKSGDTGLYAKAIPDDMLNEILCFGDRQLLQPATLFKATTFQSIGYFNPDYKIAGDYDWFLRYFADPSSRPYYHPQPFVSYHHGGLSSNVRLLLTEVFSILDGYQQYQTPDYLIKRLKALELKYIDQYDFLEKTNQLSLQRLKDIHFLESELENSNALSLNRLSLIHQLEQELSHLKIQALQRSNLKQRVKRVLKTIQRKLRVLS